MDLTGLICLTKIYPKLGCDGSHILQSIKTAVSVPVVGGQTVLVRLSGKTSL